MTQNDEYRPSCLEVSFVTLMLFDATLTSRRTSVTLDNTSTLSVSGWSRVTKTSTVRLVTTDFRSELISWATNHRANRFFLFAWPLSYAWLTQSTGNIRKQPTIGPDGAVEVERTDIAPVSLKEKWLSSHKNCSAQTSLHLMTHFPHDQCEQQKVVKSPTQYLKWKTS